MFQGPDGHLNLTVPVPFGDCTFGIPLNLQGQDLTMLILFL